MATLPTSIKVNRQDVKSAPLWLLPLMSTYNTFNQAIYDALNNQLTFVENIRCQIKEFTFRTQGDYSMGGWTDISFPCDLKTKATGLWMMQIVRTDGDVIDDSVFVNWKYDNGTIVIPWITGLDNATQYALRLMIV